MLELAPYIIIAIILSAVVGGVIGRLLSKTAYNEDSGQNDGNTHHTFHVDRATGIVSECR